MFTLELELTKRCNLNCRYCYQTHQQDEMTEELAKQAINFGLERVQELGLQELKVIYFGGEPLLKFDLMKKLTEYVTEQAQKADLRPSFEMTTNGLLFTQEVSEFCTQYPFRVKLSLDGTPENHNLNRQTSNGKGSYDLVMENVDAFNYYQTQAQRPVQISMVIDQNTCANFSQNVEHIVDKGFSFIDCNINLYQDWDRASLATLEGELVQVADLYVARAKAGRPFNWTLFDYAIRPYFVPRENYYCGAGVISNFVSTEGVIYPCTGSTKEAASIGHLSTGYAEERLAPYANYQRRLQGKCGSCQLKQYCKICDCIVLNLEFTDDLYQVPPILCEMSRIKDRVARQIAVQLAEIGLIDLQQISFEEVI